MSLLATHNKLHILQCTNICLRLAVGFIIVKTNYKKKQLVMQLHLLLKKAESLRRGEERVRWGLVKEEERDRVNKWLCIKIWLSVRVWRIFTTGVSINRSREPVLALWARYSRLRSPVDCWICSETVMLKSVLRASLSLAIPVLCTSVCLSRISIFSICPCVYLLSVYLCIYLLCLQTQIFSLVLICY